MAHARSGPGLILVPRILCYLHSFEPGGVERMALRLCRAWRDDGLDVVIVMGRDEGALRCENPSLAYRALPRPGLSTRHVETLWMLLWLPGMLRRTRPDILFCAGNSYTIVAVLLRLLLGRRCPPIVAKISNDLARPDMIAPIRWGYHRWCRVQGLAIDRFVALSDAMRDEAAAILAIPARRIAVIPDPVLTETQIAELAEAGRRPRGGADGRAGRRFLAIGRLASQKDFPLLLRAFARGAAADDRLTILGEGPERSRLERLIRALGLADRVRLQGHSACIGDWLACSDIFILSSRYEGAPAVIVEAMATGLPIIATDCCRSMAGLIGGMAHATLVPAGDEAALADAIAARHPIGATTDPEALQRFRVEPVARAYARLLGQCAAGGRAVATAPAGPLPI